ncbi:MAG: hypothetical protein HYW06_08765 [Gemmatimonadetes bacterium]|nr:hypothetical protein [Gemmatimonadota bacterium]MBI2403240.1 hypothetical protein [Gemmatimonadota bacterium]MBI2537031.1 hypothetical protein [Gemmatimonadota bacterium]
MMDIKPDRMVYLGYGKYWRSDAIVGLMPIETERGPGRRTEVYTATLDHPIVASRSETAILQDMAIATDEALRVQEVLEVAGDLQDALENVPDVLRRLLANEARLDVDAWLRRLRELLRTAVPEPVEQNDLFQP